ncbi:MAG: type II toxin-antitoxin system HicB family antitoxin [Nitrospirae bacterium]|nr:type II toxin-antitoxin system HicB family antitoxin [Nitrospirota bacterium]
MKIKQKTLYYNLIFSPEPEGGFTVIVPSLPGCVTYGKTLQEAKKMVRDAIWGYLESLRKHGESIPSNAETFVSTVDINATEELSEELIHA